MLKLYNTLSRKKEKFVPVKKGKVGMYVCGPTIYDYVHIGNLRAYVFSDILRRVLKANEFKIKEVMNLTDVDDKTIRDSQKAKKSLKEFTKKYEKGFLEDIKAINIETPEVLPKATEHIKDMIEIVKRLLKKKIAYKTDDGIYFSIKKFKDYGKLSKIDMKNLLVKASGRVSADEYEKENARDFALWKFWDEADGNVFWKTDLGKGRPGWHIECSSMSSKYLGKQFDIHTGGVDLIFPHHENEIAQSEAAFGKKPWVKYWLHNEWIMVDGKKMSKSLGNFYNLKDLENKGYSAMDLRYFYLSAHYRKPLNFTFKNLDASQNALKRLKTLIAEMKQHHPRVYPEPNRLLGAKIKQSNIEGAKNQFLEIINDDLNTPKALSFLWEILREDKLNDAEKYKLVLKFDNIFGLRLGEEEKVNVPTKVKKLVNDREKARKKKDFVTADKIRENIKKEGYYINDTDDGAVVKKL